MLFVFQSLSIKMTSVNESYNIRLIGYLYQRVLTSEIRLIGYLYQRVLTNEMVNVTS